MPTHIVTMPYFSFLRCSAWITVAERIAPVAPLPRPLTRRIKRRKD